MTNTFRSYAQHYEQNVSDGAGATAQPATLEPHQGVTEPGIAIRVRGLPRLVIPLTDALRLATEIADAAAEHLTERNKS